MAAIVVPAVGTSQGSQAKLPTLMKFGTCSEPVDETLLSPGTSLQLVLGMEQ